MKFFKHFVDSHRGQSMSVLMEEMGHVGHSCYWILVEMCAEKLDKGSSELFTEEHCVFTFHERILRQNLRLTRGKLERFLRQCEALALLSLTLNEDSFQISMPKLLECLDRDAKRARTERAAAALKNKRKKKNKSKSDPRSSDELYSSLPEQLLTNLLKKYDDVWVRDQVGLCFDHYTLGNKTVKSWPQTVSGWFGRARNPILKITGGERIGTMCGVATDV